MNRAAKLLEDPAGCEADRSDLSYRTPSTSRGLSRTSSGSRRGFARPSTTPTSRSRCDRDRSSPRTRPARRLRWSSPCSPRPRAAGARGRPAARVERSEADRDPTTLVWYTHPADKWENACPSATAGWERWSSAGPTRRRSSSTRRLSGREDRTRPPSGAATRRCPRSTGCSSTVS